jgi:ParB family chromosome partitioning protein
MNPPFANNQDVRHIRQAWDLLRPGGRLVAICCEGPFFRADRFAVQFRDWLDKIGAETEKLPHGTFRESGTDVATRLLWATKAGPEAQLRALWTAEGNDPARQDAIVADITAKAAPGAAVGPFRIAGEVRAIPLTQVESDPGQPRKTFEEGALRELAASIRENGLLQPISVREIAPDRFCIVAGERRFRAHQLLGAATVPAIVIQTAGAADIRVKQIIENDQRADVPPLEQARSYQALMDETGWTVEQLAARVGKAPWRIRERTALLALQPEYQGLLASGNLKPSEAAEMARLATPRAQATLFTAIRTGACRTYNDLRATATALANVEAQPAFTLAAAPPPTEAERSDASAFEAQVERVSAMLRAGIDENRVVAVKKVSPHRAGHLADLLGAMQGDLRRIELGLRTAAVQASFLEA